MDAQISTVQFHEQSITVIEHQGQPYVGIRSIVENIGLDWKSQYSRIKRHAVLSSTVVMMTTVAQDGKRRQIFALPLSMLNGWLFGVEVNRVRPELRDRLLRYQFECFDVLYRHFMPAAPSSTLSFEPQAILNARKQLTEAVWNKGGVKVDWSQIMPDGEAALGLVGSILMSSRWLLTFDPSTLHHRLCPIPERALMLTPEQIIEQFSDFRFSAEQTRTLLNKCGDELYRYKGLADEAKDRIAHLSRQRRVALTR